MLAATVHLPDGSKRLSSLPFVPATHQVEGVAQPVRRQVEVCSGAINANCAH
jgi:hypothetical protein